MKKLKYYFNILPEKFQGFIVCFLIVVYIELFDTLIEVVPKSLELITKIIFAVLLLIISFKIGLWFKIRERR